MEFAECAANAAGINCGCCSYHVQSISAAPSRPSTLLDRKLDYRQLLENDKSNAGLPLLNGSIWIKERSDWFLGIAVLGFSISTLFAHALKQNKCM
jgi:hypothetical protein